MRRLMFIAGFIVAGMCFAAEASAQWLPERKMVRGANKEYDAGNYSQAEVGYRKAIEKMKEPAGLVYNAAMFNLSDAMYKQERYEEAEKNFVALAQDSVHTDLAAQSYYNAGNAMTKQRKLEEALEAYKNAMRRDPSDKAAKFNYAYVKKLLEKDDDQNEGGGGDNQDNQDNQDDQNNQDNQDNQDQNDPQQDPQDQNGDNDDKQDEGQNDEQDDPKNDPQQEDKNDGEQRENPAGMSREDADKMLEIEQMNEDKTRENMQEKGAALVGKSGKNW